MISEKVKINKIGLNRNYYLIKIKGTLNQQPPYREILYLDPVIKQLAVGKGMRERKSERAMVRWGELKGANIKN